MVTEEEVLDTLQGQDEFEDEAMDYLPVIEEELEEDLGKTWSFGNSLRLEKVAVDKFILFILKGSRWEILEEFESFPEAEAYIQRFKETYGTAEPVVCPVCKEEFDSFEEFEEHWDTEHESKYGSYQKPEEKSLTNERVKEIFRQELTKEKGFTEVDVSPISCPLCEKKVSRTLLKAHVLKEHKENLMQKLEDKVADYKGEIEKLSKDLEKKSLTYKEALLEKGKELLENAPLWKRRQYAQRPEYLRKDAEAQLLVEYLGFKGSGMETLRPTQKDVRTPEQKKAFRDRFYKAMKSKGEGITSKETKILTEEQKQAFLEKFHEGIRRSGDIDPKIALRRPEKLSKSKKKTLESSILEMMALETEEKKETSKEVKKEDKPKRKSRITRG